MNNKTAEKIFPVVMPNLVPTVQCSQTHILPLPACCPISGNPQVGSTIEISYDSRNGHLEVYQLNGYIQAFVGGQKCPHSGEYFVREQEQMIQAIAQYCANLLNVEVQAIAKLKLDVGEMIVQCVAVPVSK